VNEALGGPPGAPVAAYFRYEKTMSIKSADVDIEKFYA
jgi:hypothetical protein